MSDQQEYMSTKEAGEFLGVHPRTVWRWVDEDTLTGYRIGRVLRVRKQEIEEVLRGER